MPGTWAVLTRILYLVTLSFQVKHQLTHTSENTEGVVVHRKLFQTIKKGGIENKREKRINM